MPISPSSALGRRPGQASHDLQYSAKCEVRKHVGLMLV